jgi:hypothetical protein
MTTKISSDLWILKQHGSKRISQGVGLFAAKICPIKQITIYTGYFIRKKTEKEKRKTFVAPPRVERYNLFKVKWLLYTETRKCTISYKLCHPKQQSCGKLGG